VVEGRPVEVVPLVQDPAPRFWLWELVAGAIGVAASVVAYGALASRLPPTIPSQYDVNGAVTGTMPPFDLLLVGIGTNLLVAGLFVGLLYGLGRSEVLRHRFGPGLLRPLAVFGVVLTAVSLPATFLLVLASGAGAVPGWFPPQKLILPIVAFPPALGLILALAIQAGTTGFRLPSLTAPASLAGASPGRNLILRCSACGHLFERAAWYVLAPRVGGLTPLGGAAYYLRCPVCGERGWNSRVGWGRLAAGGNAVPSGSDRSPPAASP
jgi:hypothetical protein